MADWLDPFGEEPWDAFDSFEDFENAGYPGPVSKPEYKPEESAAAIKSVISEAMMEIGMKEEDVSEGPFAKERRYREVQGFAWFNCPKEHHRWSSFQASCWIDFKKQSLYDRGLQKCHKCNSDVAPEFSLMVIRKMARAALERIYCLIQICKEVKQKPQHESRKGEESHSVADKGKEIHSMAEVSAVSDIPEKGAVIRHVIAKEVETYLVGEKGESTPESHTPPSKRRRSAS